MSALGRRGQVDLCKFKAGLVYRASFKAPSPLKREVGCGSGLTPALLRALEACQVKEETQGRARADSMEQ